MNEVQPKEQPDDAKGQHDLKANRGGAPHDPPGHVPGGEAGEAGGAKGGSNNPKEKGGEKNPKGRKNFRDWLYTTEITDVLLVIIGSIALWIACTQNSLIEKSNTISTNAVAAAESTAAIADKALQAQKDGEETAKKTAEAIQATAEANKSTADATADIAKAGKDTAEATKAVAEENRKTAAATYWLAKETSKAAVATQQIADVAALALKTSQEAGTYAGRAAESAEASVTLARESMVHELRAYLSVLGTDLRYDQVGKKITATITIENTGRTPAHEVEFFWNVKCTDRIGGVPQRPPPVKTAQTPTSPSFGPKAGFRFTKSWPVPDGVDPNTIGRMMDMWVFGMVNFKDEFTDDEHFTQFSFTQGKRIGTTNQWEMHYTKFGNACDRAMIRQRIPMPAPDPPTEPAPADDLDELFRN